MSPHRADRHISRCRTRARGVQAFSVAIASMLALLTGSLGSSQGAGVAPEDAIRLGQTDDDEVISFSVVLEQPGRRELLRTLEEIADRDSPGYGRRIPPAEFGERFGLSNRQIDKLVKWLESHEIAVVQRPPQRTSLGVRGSARRVGELFGIRLIEWRDATGQRYHAPDRKPTIPAEIRRLVAGIDGLDNEPLRPATPSFAVRNGIMRPEDVALAYEIDALHGAGLHGERQTVAIVSFDTFTDIDVATFDEETGIAALGGDPPDVIRRRIAGAPTQPGSSSQEVALDIQVIRAIAPQAQIVNYEGPLGDGFAPVMREIVSRNEADIVSISWGRCERRSGTDVRSAEDLEFEAAFAAGTTVFVASGDHGAYGCRFSTREGERRSDLSESVDYPSASPFVVSVGGTYLSVRTDGTYLEEAAWEDALSGWSTGGGLSNNYLRPSWQRGHGVENSRC